MGGERYDLGSEIMEIGEGDQGAEIGGGREIKNSPQKISNAF